MKSEEILYWIWFSRIRNVGCVKKEKLLNLYGSPKIIWKLKENELENSRILSKENIDEILNPRYKQNLSVYVDYMKKNNIHIITLYDENYPENLKQIYDNPIVLYAKGNLKLLNSNGIAIVGSRNCTEYGKTIATEIAYNIAKTGKCVISGLAKGIDSFAHLGAINAEGDTIGVLGCGLDNIYPSENKELAERIIKSNGLLISEYIVGMKPEKKNFPERNRIISALSRGIVVVEAREKSGALITADFGLEQGKEIFAVPGNIDNSNSKGTNELIKQGAYILTEYKDVINTCYNNYNY